MNASKLRLYHRLQIAAHAVRKTADRLVFDAASVTTAQAAVLSVVVAGDYITQRHVAIALGLNESAVTAMVARLLKLGLLQRMRSGRDSRAWCLRVSSTGKSALRASRAAFSLVNGRIGREFSQREIKQLVDYLDRLAAAF